MERNLPKVIEGSPPQGVEVGAYFEVHFKFCMMFLQTHQEALYLKEIFQNVPSKFFDALHYL